MNSATKAFLTTLLIVIGAGCRVVPVQMTRVSQTESYRQSFHFEGATAEEQGRNARVVLPQIVGEENYQHLVDLYAHILDEFLEDGIEARGMFNFDISLVPSDHSRFFVSGIGKYFIVRNSTQEVLFGGDFYVVPEEFALSALADEGQVNVRFKQYLSSYMDAPAGKKVYVSDQMFDVELKIQTYAGKGLYRIDYEAPHTIRLGGQHIGEVRFDDDPSNAHKVIDLRGLRMVRKDYAKKMK